MKYVVIDRKVWSLQPVFLCKDKCFAPIDVDEVNEKMKCCGNCKHEQDSNTDYYCEDCKRFANETDIEKNGSQQNEI